MTEQITREQLDKLQGNFCQCVKCREVHTQLMDAVWNLLHPKPPAARMGYVQFGATYEAAIEYTDAVKARCAPDAGVDRPDLVQTLIDGHEKSISNIANAIEALYADAAPEIGE